MTQPKLDIDNMDLTIQVKGKDANVILAGLAELPAKNSFDVIMKVKGQAEQQVASAMQTLTPANEAAPAGQQLLTEDKQ